MKKKKKDQNIAELIIKPLPASAQKIINKYHKEKKNDSPNHIMQNALLKTYDININDSKKYKEFISYLMKNLSLLVTGNDDDSIFEPDFNKFFTLVVRTINECGEMLEILKQYGIDYKPKWSDDIDNIDDNIDEEN